MRATMRLFSPFLILLSASFLCSVSIPSSAGQTDQATPSSKPHPSQLKKVLTDEDLQGLPSGSGVTTFLPAAEVVSAPSKGELRLAADRGRASLERKPYVKETDPRWYLEHLDSARIELESIDSTVQRIREFRKSGMGSAGGITLDQPGLRLSPENEVEQLARRRQELAMQIAELEDTARHNGFSPGLLRGSLPANAPPESALAPSEQPPLTPEQERTAWQEKLQPLREELAQVEGVVRQMENEAAARGITLYPVTVGGSATADLLRRLKARAGVLQLEISAIEDEARRASAPPGWLR
jgi:hypothetical protein